MCLPQVCAIASVDMITEGPNKVSIHCKVWGIAIMIYFAGVRGMLIKHRMLTKKAHLLAVLISAVD